MKKSGLLPEVKEHRTPEHEIDPLILNRWSPRAFTGEEMPEEDLMKIFEAARWAPSSYNNQPWRFIYAKRNTPHWEKLFSLMGEFNQGWTKNASVLIVIISHNNFEYNGKPSRTHSFDAGSSWENMAIQATSMGYFAHGMEGFDYDRAKAELGIPDDYEVEAMIALGKKAPVEMLDKELQEREFPSTRKPLGEIIMEGTFLHQ